MASAHFLVSGRVQGVGFRYFVAGTARQLKLTGWVRNQPDGTVECVAAGSDEQLDQFEEQLRSGPPLARVSELTRQPAADPGLNSFEIRR